MSAYLVSVVMFFLCNILPAVTFYECTVEKPLSGLRTKGFENLIFAPLRGDSIFLSRIIPMGDDEIFLDEQFFNVKRARCPIPGQGGKEFYSAGSHPNSINGYRIGDEIFRERLPLSFALFYVLDKTGDGRHCVPAIYYCSR